MNETESDPAQPAATTNGPVNRRIGGLIVIGDEVLGRRIDDRNTAMVLDAFARHGIVAGEVAIVADNIDRIAVVVREFAARFDVVITTGGVGPTHDDCTWRAVAMAVDDDFVLRQEVLDMMEARAGRALTPEQQRMALLPSRAVVERLDRGWALRVDAIWVLPGVPSMVMAKIDAICSRYAAPQPHLCEVYFTADEWDVVAAVDAMVANFKQLRVGSYPLFDAALDHRLRISIEGDDRAHVDQGLGAIIAGVGADYLVRIVWRGEDAQ